MEQKECVKCGLLKSTILATGKECLNGGTHTIHGEEKKESEIVVLIVPSDEFKNVTIGWKYAAVFKESDYKKITDAVDKLQDETE